MKVDYLIIGGRKSVSKFSVKTRMSAMLTSPVSSGSVYAFKTCIISVFGHRINCSIIKVFSKYCNVTQQISEVLSTIRFNFLCQGGATNLFIRLRVLLFFIQNTSPFLIGLSYPSQLILHNQPAPIK